MSLIRTNQLIDEVPHFEAECKWFSSLFWLWTIIFLKHQTPPASVWSDGAFGSRALNGVFTDSIWWGCFWGCFIISKTRHQTAWKFPFYWVNLIWEAGWSACVVGHFHWESFTFRHHGKEALSAVWWGPRVVTESHCGALWVKRWSLVAVACCFCLFPVGMLS